jgi:hypothetical protein
MVKKVISFIYPFGRARKVSLATSLTWDLNFWKHARGGGDGEIQMPNQKGLGLTQVWMHHNNKQILTQVWMHHNNKQILTQVWMHHNNKQILTQVWMHHNNKTNINSSVNAP